MAEGRAAPYPVAELRRAVELEIDAVLNDEMVGSEKVSLHDGRLIRGGGDDREYLFSCRNWKDSFAVKDVLIRRSRAGARWAPADAARMPDGRIRVSTGTDLGTAPVTAQLVEDDTQILRTIVERLDRIGGPDSPLVLSSAGLIVGQGRPRIGRCDDPGRLLPGYGGRRLNARQRQAVEQALGSEATFIWGPPGTGKTDVVSTIVEGSYRQGLGVLFLAPTHVAVDQAMERICDLLSGEAEFGAGLVQRAGDIALPSLEAKYGDRILPGRIAERLTATLDAQITEATTRLKTVRHGIALHEEATRLTVENQRLHGWLRTVDDALAEAGRAWSASAEFAREKRFRAEQFGSPSGVFAQRKVAKRDQLLYEAAQYEQAAERSQREHTTLLQDRRRCESEIRSVQDALTPLLPRVSELDPLAALRKQAELFQSRLDDLQGERQKVADAVRRRCRVMGTTVSKAIRARGLLESADVVVIDEAGMVNLPSAWCAAGLARKRIVVAGDFRQLPAVTRGSGSRKASTADKEHSRIWMDGDPFNAAGLADEGGRIRADPRLVALNQQYRMRSEICALVNEVAYPDAPLLTARTDGSRLPPSPLIDGPLVLIDTSAKTLEGTGAEAHKSNPVHEAVIHELIRGLQYDTVLPARKWTDLRPTERIAVISPYRNQKRALDTSLKYRFGKAYEGLVDTVHRFQGSQRPLVVIDTVAGAGKQIGFFYEGTGLSSATCRLLNVALSRAQDHLVVVANVEFMRRSLDPSGEAARMLDHLERRAQRLPMEDLVPVRSAAELGGLDEAELARPAFFPADEVPRAVEWDIAHARGSIDIYCAFLSSSAVRYWLRHLRRRAAEGIRVTVHTRRPGDPGSEGLVRDLEAAGCRVSARERMHEKVMIVDDAVLWHGSLNLLAHSGSTDLMMRITDPASCERVRHIVERARMDRPARTASAPKGDVAPGDVHGGRLYLMVPYEEKDEAKRAVGARWDGARKLWHVDAKTPRDRVRRWLPENA